MAKLRLIYFDFSGSRGEECRLALSVAGVPFEDVRVPRADWPGLKPKMPFGQLPVLEEEGRPPLSQSNAILGLIGRRHGLLPAEDDWETARHLAVMSSAEELRAAIRATFDIDDPDEQRRVREELVSGPVTTWGRAVEAQVQGPFVGGERMSVADIKIHVMVGWIKKGVLAHVPVDALDGFPMLVGVYERVGDHPRVRDWYARFGPEA